MPAELNATVTMRYEINHGLLVLQVSPDEEMQPFQAGQYTILGLPGSAPRHHTADPEDPPSDPDKIIKRAYSIASSSLQGRYFEFYVAMVRSGALTPRLFALQTGDRVFLGRKVVGMFTMQEVPEDHDVVLVATGTGLAPYISMLRSRYEFDSGRKTVVVHGSRVSYDLGYRSEVEGLAARYDSFTYLPIIDMPERDPAWKGPTGYVNRFFDDGTVHRALGHEVSPENTSVFLCGNPMMIQSMLRYLDDLGLKKHARRDPGQIFVEEFWKDS
ncbi:ferredoxin--NADP reductase [bacterium]|nr:ferredoxin--NADP reductase [bacterium]